MEKQELEKLAELLILYRDDSVDQAEFHKRDSLLFDVEFDAAAMEIKEGK